MKGLTVGYGPYSVALGFPEKARNRIQKQTSPPRYFPKAASSAFGLYGKFYLAANACGDCALAILEPLLSVQSRHARQLVFPRSHAEDRYGPGGE